MTERSFILGTAGHIDHGKSSLVSALCGTDPDRLAEEKRRGISIELGFAELILPNGQKLGVVDVPGHERFIRHMVAGATGIDLALFVIAADDGIMPQTREHMTILELLGVEAGVVALTKCDLVDEEWLSFVEEEVRAFLVDTPLKDAPLVKVSTKTSSGLNDLLTALEDTVSSLADKAAADRIMRLPVDRVFTVNGIGTVVTGTLWDGTVALNDRVSLLPSGVETRVRTIQVHGKDVETARSGQRVALGLAGISKDAVERGCFIVKERLSPPSDTFDVLFEYCGIPGSGKTFETGSRVHIAHGTTEVLGRVLLMDDRPVLETGNRCFAQIRLEEPLAARYGDRFIVRSYSPVYTIGGGQVLASHPKRRTKLSAEERVFLDARLAHDDTEALLTTLRQANYPLLSADIAARLDMTEEQLADRVLHPKIESMSTGEKTYYIENTILNRCLGRIEKTLYSYHQDNPDKVALSVSALQGLTNIRCDEAAFTLLVKKAHQLGKVVLLEGMVSHPTASGAAHALEQDRKNQILAVIASSGKTPPNVQELEQIVGLEASAVYKALRQLSEEGSVVNIGNGFYFERTIYNDFKDKLIAHLTAHTQATAAELRDALSTSRKYLIPLLEHFDEELITARKDDYRVLRT